MWVLFDVYFKRFKTLRLYFAHLMCCDVLHHFSVQDMSLVFNGDVKLSKLEVGQVGDLFPFVGPGS